MATRNVPPVITPFRTTMLMAPALAMCVTGALFGDRGAGIFAAGVTLMLWAAILKFCGPREVPAPTVRTSRPVFVDHVPLEPVTSERVDRIARVAADGRAPAGEREAAIEALRRLGEM